MRWLWMSRSAFLATHITLFVVCLYFCILSCDGIDGKKTNNDRYSNINGDGDNGNNDDDIGLIILLWMLTSLIFIWINVEPFTLFTFTIVSSAFKIKFECFLVFCYYFVFLKVFRLFFQFNFCRFHLDRACTSGTNNCHTKHCIRRSLTLICSLIR